MSEPTRRGSDGTRQLVLRATIDLLAEHGTTGTGLNQVAAESGVSYGSVYNQFRSGKDELIATAISQAGAELDEALTTVLAEVESLEDGCSIIFGFGSATLENSSFTMGCPIGTPASDGHGSDAIAMAANEAFSAGERIIGQAARRFGATPADADVFASAVVSLYEGALLTSRVARSTKPLEQACEAACRLARSVTT